MKEITKITTFLILSMSILFSQGAVTGTVKADDGAVLPGANVYLDGTNLGAASDANGNYNITDIPAGDYTLIASAIGYKRSEAAISVTDGLTTDIHFSLATDVLGMDALVVTGTPGGKSMQKRDASFAINTLNAQDIRRASPSSTANLLDAVPGVWSESSGGIAGANIFVRGLPSSGDAPFVTMSVNGSPIYGVETLSFFEQSTLFRIDETVESTEALRGGPSAIFSNAEPGMTVNFNLRKGSELSEGRIKYETSDYNSQRIDGFMSGKVIDGLYFMVGGYVHTSPGIRSMEFNGENGKQLTVQLTKIFKGGVLNTYTRHTDDVGQWVLPMALETGNDLGTFSPLGNATRFRTLQINTQGDSVTFDFANGRGWTGSMSGINGTFDLGNGWTVRDNFAYTSGDANTFGFVPSGSPVQVSALGLDTVRTRGGEILSDSDYVQNYGHWVVMKDLESINNDLSFSKKLGSQDITVGFYQARWSAGDFWTLGNHIPVHNVANGDLLESGITADSLTAHGGGGSWNYGLQYAGDARVSAVYVADSWQVSSALRLDLGFRKESFELQYTLDHGGHPDGSIDKAESLTGNETALTAAVNFDLSDNLGLFGRYSDGYMFPHFDMIRESKYSVNSDGNVDANEFKQVEFGVKYNSKLFSLFATGFSNNVDVFDGDVGSTRESALLNTQTNGVELDGVLSFGSLKVKSVATFQKGEIKASDVDDSIVGNSIWRQPDMQLRISPSYDLSFGNSTATIYGVVKQVGDRWDGRGNDFQLDGYTKIDAGVNVTTQSGMIFSCHIDNLTDSEGLTEGDPRDPASANGRPIFGRSIKFSVAYDF